MTQILKNHKWAILLAVLAGIIIAYPQAYFRYQNQDIYQGQAIEILTGSPFWALIQEVRDGHFFGSSPHFKDGKDDPYLFQPLGPIIFTFWGKIFFLDLNNTLLLGRLFFSFLVFLVIYSFVFLFSKDRLTALTSSTVILLADELLSRQGLLQILSGESPRTFLYFFRPVVPIMPFLFFFSFLLFFWLFFEKRRWRWGIISAAILGLSFYDYFYTWSFLYAFLGVLLLIFLFQKKWQDFKRIMIVPLGGGLISIPYWINFYQASLYPTYQEVMQRIGLIESHALGSPGFLVPLVFVIFLIFFPRKYKKRYLFSLALLITPFIVLNQQLITGRVLLSGHYHWRNHVPLAIIFLLVIFFYWVSRKRWEFFKKMAAVLIIGVSIYTGIFIQQQSLAEVESKAIEDQRYGKVLEWFNTNAEKEEVVFANNELSYFTVSYTPLNVFYTHIARYCLCASKERLLNILFLFYRLDGVEKDEAEEVFFRDKGQISGSIYAMYWRELTGNQKNIPDEIIQEFAQKYQKSLAVSNDDFFNNLWDKYEVKYLVWDKKQDPHWQLDQYPFLKKTAAIGDFIIYQNDF